MTYQQPTSLPAEIITESLLTGLSHLAAAHDGSNQGTAVRQAAYAMVPAFKHLSPACARFEADQIVGQVLVALLPYIAAHRYVLGGGEVMDSDVIFSQAVAALNDDPANADNAVLAGLLSRRPISIGHHEDDDVNG